MQSLDRYKWIDTYYNHVTPNQIVNKDKIWFIKKVSHEVEENFVGEANITKNGNCYSIKIIKHNH
jgi:hypothetical protein